MLAPLRLPSSSLPARGNFVIKALFVICDSLPFSWRSPINRLHAVSPSIDRDVLAGYVLGFVRRQEGDQCGDFFRSGVSPKRDLRIYGRKHFVRVFGALSIGVST